ncbi:unnamed protein product, partial [Iphiclides podalirius]
MWLLIISAPALIYARGVAALSSREQGGLKVLAALAIGNRQRAEMACISCCFLLDYIFNRDRRQLDTSNTAEDHTTCPLLEIQGAKVTVEKMIQFTLYPTPTSSL